MKIARVFPTKTSMSPTDEDAYFGLPYWFTPKYDEIHISVTFTWDLEYADHLKLNWERYGKVKIGGPALGDPGGNFTPGFYLRKEVVITSRGCPNNCPWCFVPKREGKIRELPIVEGNIIQDNNLLACSKSHIRKVFTMLKSQKRIDFPGGLEASRITDGIVEQLRDLRIYQLWLAFDNPNQEKSLRRAVKKLSQYFPRNKIRCYVLIGYGEDSMIEAGNRLKTAWEIGTLPFAMLYQPKDKVIYSKEVKRFTHDWSGPFSTRPISELSWGQFQRQWSRPASIKSMMKKGD